MKSAAKTLRNFGTFLVLTLIFVAIVVHPSHSQAFLHVTVDTEFTNYHYRQLVKIYGNVTYNGELVSEGLVAIQIQDPTGQTIALRTVPANATPSQAGTVEIISFYSCDMGGQPKSSFRKNTMAYFNITVRNSSPAPTTYTLTLNPHDIDSTPFYLYVLSITSPLPPGYAHSHLLPTPIEDDWISTGPAVAYANVLTGLPNAAGYAYDTEKSAPFTITTTTGLETPAPESSEIQLSEAYNSFETSVRLSPEIPLGTCNIIVSASSLGSKASNSETFIRLFEERGDIIFNRIIDIYDIVEIASAYGKTGGQSKWNPEADLNEDAKVDIYDIVLVAGKYGREY